VNVRSNKIDSEISDFELPGDTSDEEREARRGREEWQEEWQEEWRERRCGAREVGQWR